MLSALLAFVGGDEHPMTADIMQTLEGLRSAGEWLTLKVCIKHCYFLSYWHCWPVSAATTPA